VALLDRILLAFDHEGMGSEISGDVFVCLAASHLRGSMICGRIINENV
jgi:hypothetical protein